MAKNSDTMDDRYALMKADRMGRELTGFGVNLLVRQPVSHARDLALVLGLRLIRSELHFALLSWPVWGSDGAISGHHLLQLHSDASYADNPLPSLLPEFGVRGGGIELRLFGADPDTVVARAVQQPGWGILAPPRDKPHGLREAYVTDTEGYCWVPSLALPEVGNE